MVQTLGVAGLLSSSKHTSPPVQELSLSHFAQKFCTGWLGWQSHLSPVSLHWPTVEPAAVATTQVCASHLGFSTEPQSSQMQYLLML